MSLIKRLKSKTYSFKLVVIKQTLIMNLEFLSLFLLLLFSFTLSIVISGASYTLSEKEPNGDKVSAYECGFDPLESSRVPFSVRFFLVGILFMIFDLEISYLFPWSVTYNQIGVRGF